MNKVLFKSVLWEQWNTYIPTNFTNICTHMHTVECKNVKMIEKVILKSKVQLMALSESPETMRKLCLSTRFPHQEIRWNYGILCSECCAKDLLKFLKGAFSGLGELLASVSPLKMIKKILFIAFTFNTKCFAITILACVFFCFWSSFLDGMPKVF